MQDVFQPCSLQKGSRFRNLFAKSRESPFGANKEGFRGRANWIFSINNVRTNVRCYNCFLSPRLIFFFSRTVTEEKYRFCTSTRVARTFLFIYLLPFLIGKKLAENHGVKNYTFKLEIVAIKNKCIQIFHEM